MSMPLRLARAILPVGVKDFLKRGLRGLVPVRHAITYPFKPPLGREILRLELSKRARDVRALDGFEEMRDSGWWGLTSIGHRIVRHYRPKVIVELGTHKGASAFAMGMALRDLGEGGRLFAVDSWEGDDHAGHYDEGVYRTFLARREQLALVETIVPLRVTFDEAVGLVPTPIDLLHVDGLHTLDAVRHDFETFGPLVRPGGLILFHDVDSRFDGVRQFWAGISREYDHHTIRYSNGLGIIRV